MLFQRRKRTKDATVDAPAVSGKTDVGKVRSGNEDVYRILEGKEAPDGIDAIMVVADGMGGHAAGEVASEMAADGVVRHLTNRPADATKPGGGYSQLLGQILSEVNREVHRAGQKPEYQGMGTTCTVAVLTGDQLHVGHVGDSRGYIMRQGDLRQISKDHGWVAEQVEAGNLTLEQAANHQYRNVVTRAIGTEKEVKVDTLVESVAPGDTVLLCSDGLHSVVGAGDIAEVLKRGDPKAVCNGLVELANANGGPDNITVVVAQIGGQDRTESKDRLGATDKTIVRERRRRSSGPVGWITRRLFRCR